jgi:IS30 family transposase
MRMISERPAEALDRRQAGHWKGDLIMGPGNQSAIGTLVERSTRFLIFAAFPDRVPTTGSVRAAVCQALERLTAWLRRTLTWDQGKELAHHQRITQLNGTPVFFCDAHAPGSAAATKT